jgi:ADP-heptose:LPS heptosyltransferase
MATPFAAVRGAPEVRRLRAALRPRFAALRGLRGFPEPGTFSVLAPDSSYLGERKAWPLEHWRALIEALQQPATGLPRAVVVCAGPETVARIGGGLGCDVVAFDYTDPRLNGDLSNLASVVAAAAFTVSLDSGTAHLASLLEAPCVSLWGPTSPVIYASPNTTALRTSLCPPCSADVRSSLCRDSVCMANLSPHTVVRVLQRLAARTRRHD